MNFCKSYFIGYFRVKLVLWRNLVFRSLKKPRLLIILRRRQLLLSRSRVRLQTICIYTLTERESLLAQTLNNFIQIKAKALGHRKKTFKQVVSSVAPQQLHKFLTWFKVDGRINANLIRLLFWTGCSLLDDQHSCAGVLGRTRIYRGLLSSARSWAW